jgi:putative ABC transport system permease protein
MKFPAGLVFAHARKNWFRSLLTLGSVFVALLVYGTLQTAVESLEITVKGVSSTRVITESAVSLFVTLPRKTIEEVKAAPGVKETDGSDGPPRKMVTQFTWFGGTWVDERNFFARFGCNPVSLRDCYDDDIDMVPQAPGETEDEIWKRFAATRTGCVVGVDLAASKGFKVGDRITLKGSIYPGVYELQVVGIYTSRNPSYDKSTLYFHWDYLNEVSKANGGPAETIGVISTCVVDPERAGETAAAIDAMYESSSNRTRTLTERAFQAQFASMWGGMPAFFQFLGLVALAASLVVTLNTALLNMQERIRETGVLKTLGFTDGVVLTLSLAEAAFLCGLGGAFAAPAVSSLHGKVLPGLNIPLYVPPDAPLRVLAVAVGLGGVAGVVPALRASRLKITEALRRRA